MWSEERGKYLKVNNAMIIFTFFFFFLQHWGQREPKQWGS